MKSANGYSATAHRVLVIDNRSILGAGVETLLSNSGHLQVVGSVPNDEMDLLRHVWRFTPDVIVLSSQSQLTNPIRLLSLLKNYGSFRLIVVSEDDNTMEVYEKRQVTARGQDDLATAIRHN